LYSHKSIGWYRARLIRHYLEVKSHLKRVIMAELTKSETRFAEIDPYSYIECNVMGLEDIDPAL
jgi:hypothetical protein